MKYIAVKVRKILEKSSVTENSTAGSNVIIFMDPPLDRVCDQAIFCGIKMTYDVHVD